MRVERKKYGVTFNGERGSHCCGEERMGTTDYIGDDLDELIKEVVDESIAENFPLTYYPCDDGDEVVGIFCDEWSIEEVEGDELPSPTAILYREFR